MQLTTSGPLATQESLLQAAMLAEQLDYASLAVTDHVVIPYTIRSVQPYSATGRPALLATASYFEPLVTLAFIAGHTRRVRLGTSVLVLPYRNPVLTAKMLATLDVLAGGRLFVGVGLGWMAEEFEALGAPSFAHRGRVADEWLAIFRRLWTEPRATFHGQFYAFRDVGCFPQPAQRPHPPLLVGGNSRAALRRAARLGQGWQPFRVPPSALPGLLERLYDELDACGRDRRGFEVSLRYGARVVGPGGDRERRPEEVPGKVFVGTAPDVAEALKPLLAVRPDHVIFDCRTGSWGEAIETFTRLADEVWPRLRGELRRDEVAGGAR